MKCGTKLNLKEARTHRVVFSVGTSLKAAPFTLIISTTLVMKKKLISATKIKDFKQRFCISISTFKSGIEDKRLKRLQSKMPP